MRRAEPRGAEVGLADDARFGMRMHAGRKQQRRGEAFGEGGLDGVGGRGAGDAEGPGVGGGIEERRKGPGVEESADARRARSTAARSRARGRAEARPTSAAKGRAAKRSSSMSSMNRPSSSACICFGKLGDRLRRDGAARREAGDDAPDCYFFLLAFRRHGFLPAVAMNSRARSANPDRRASTRAWISSAGRPVSSAMPSSTLRTA